MTGHLKAAASALRVLRDARPGCGPVGLLRMRKILGGTKKGPHAEERRQARLDLPSPKRSRFGFAQAGARRMVIQRLFSAFFQPALGECDSPAPEGAADRKSTRLNSSH